MQCKYPFGFKSLFYIDSNKSKKIPNLTPPFHSNYHPDIQHSPALPSEYSVAEKLLTEIGFCARILGSADFVGCLASN